MRERDVMERYVKKLVFVTMVLISSPAVLLAIGADPNGSATLAADPTAAVNFAWVLVAAFLVFFMQAGFALVETGMCKAKNAVNILTKNFMDFSIGGLAFWAFGFAVMFGGSAAASGLGLGNKIIGYSGFFLSGAAYDVSTAELWLFQLVFAATAATIVSGSMAERTKITSYMAYSFIVSAVIYPIYGHWIWGGGWLSQLPFGAGAVDFAGSGVVHTVGGLMGLTGAAVLGPRIGKYDENSVPRQMPGHNVAYVVLGTFILFFGWFGFNTGSTLAATDLRISVIAVNTFLAGVTAAVVVVYWIYLKTAKVDLLAAANATLAGLVSITASCAYVPPWAAVVIGAIGGFLMLWGMNFIEKTLKIDDPVGAISVHGVAGLWGVLSVGIFADGTYGGVSGLIVGNTSQILAQAISAVVLVVYTLTVGFLTFYGLKKTMGLRASKEEEEMGLDISEHGITCYNQ